MGQIDSFVIIALCGGGTTEVTSLALGLHSYMANLVGGGYSATVSRDEKWVASMEAELNSLY